MMLMQSNNHEMDDAEIALLNLIENMVNGAMDSDEVKRVGDPNARTTQDTKPLAPAPGKPTEAKPPAHLRVHARADEHDTLSYDDESDRKYLLDDDVMHRVTASSGPFDDGQRHVSKASAMLDVYDEDLVDDDSHPTLYRCVENLR